MNELPMKNTLVTLILVISAAVFLMPQAALSVATPPPLDYSGFVKCDGVPNPEEPQRNVRCDFNALMDTVIKTINWAFVISIPVVTALFAYAGLLYMTGRPNYRTKANTIFTSVGIGFIIVITAWFIVHTVVDWLVDKSVVPNATIFIEQQIK